MTGLVFTHTDQNINIIIITIIVIIIHHHRPLLHLSSPLVTLGSEGMGRYCLPAYPLVDTRFCCNKSLLICRLWAQIEAETKERGEARVVQHQLLFCNLHCLSVLSQI